MPIVKGLSSENKYQTKDQDLVQLAGYHAYQKYDLADKITINEIEFEVLNTKYDTDSGLDALTVENVNTKELTVVFVGSEQTDKDWKQTNSKLLNRVPPAQLVDAQKYFDEVNKNFGKVSSVTGNSLGGALANSVAINHPELNSVTLNPAILPESMIDDKGDYSHMKNYFSKYDVLTKAEVALSMEKQIPGSHYGINNGLPRFSMIVSNHTGYGKKDNDGKFTVEIGKKGEPGYGLIHIGADEHIVTSLLNGNVLYGGNSELVDINAETLRFLADGIKEQVKARLLLAGTYLKNSTDIVKYEHALFDKRVYILQEEFKQLIEQTAGDPLFKGIAISGNILKDCICGLTNLLELAEEKCMVLNTILNSKPAELIEHVTNTDISVEALFGPPKRMLANLSSGVDDFVVASRNILFKHFPKLLEGGFEKFADAVADELDAHYDIMQTNQTRIIRQMDLYERQIRGTADAFEQNDKGLASEIGTFSNITSNLGTIETTELINLEASPYLKQKMKIKSIQTNLAFSSLNGFVSSLMMPIISVLHKTVLLIEKGLETILTALDRITGLALYGNPIGGVLSLFTDFDQKVKAAVRAVKKPIEEMEIDLEGVRKGLGKLKNNLPFVIQDFKPFVDTAIFEPGRFENVRMYNLAASAICEEMTMAFNEIVERLSIEKGKAIKGAVRASSHVRNQFLMLNEQVDRGTI